MKKNHLTNRDVSAVIHRLPSLVDDYEKRLNHLRECERCRTIVRFRRKKFVDRIQHVSPNNRIATPGFWCVKKNDLYDLAIITGTIAALLILFG